MRELVYAVDKAEAEQAQKPKMVEARSEKPPYVDASEPYAPNGLTKASWRAMRSMDRPFSIGDIVELLNETGFRFVAAKPKVAVAGPVKAYEKRKFIRLVSRGAGNEPNTYELTELGKSSE